MEDKLYTEGIATPKGKFAKWWENYWYHYKWHTIGISFALIVLLVCTVQACSREKTDLTVIYAGPAAVQMDEAAFSEFQAILEDKMPRDFDGNGDKALVLQRYDILSEAQVESVEAMTDEDGKQVQVVRDYISSQHDEYISFLQYGESSILLLDPWLYENLKNGNQAYLCTLESVLVTVPKAAMDEYGIRLGDTEWYRLYPVLANLPEDTVLCLANPLQIGKSSNETEYLHSKEMFAVLAESELKTAS